MLRRAALRSGSSPPSGRRRSTAPGGRRLTCSRVLPTAAQTGESALRLRVRSEAGRLSETVLRDFFDARKKTARVAWRGAQDHRQICYRSLHDRLRTACARRGRRRVETEPALRSQPVPGRGSLPALLPDARALAVHSARGRIRVRRGCEPPAVRTQSCRNELRLARAPVPLLAAATRARRLLVAQARQRLEDPGLSDEGRRRGQPALERRRFRRLPVLSPLEAFPRRK